MQISPTKNKILLFFIAFVFIFSLNFFQEKIKNFFYFISSPLQKVLWGAGDNTSDLFIGIFQGKNLIKENDDLKQKVQELVSEASALKELKTENEFLRTALSLGEEKEFQLKMADIIGKDISIDSLIVNKGKKDGISEGNPVITSQKVLVGKIGEVLDNFSKIILISSKDSSFDAKIGDSDAYGAVKGKGYFEVWLELIPKEKEVKIGDTVITSAFGGIFPKNLLVGEVVEVQKSDVEPFQKAKIEIYAKFQDLKTVFIIGGR
jgi:rod shape-determining protein MreC